VAYPLHCRYNGRIVCVAHAAQDASSLGGIMNFSLSAPRRETFLVSAIIAILVVIGMIVPLPFFTSYALGLLLISYLILVAGVLIDGL